MRLYWSEGAFLVNFARAVLKPYLLYLLLPSSSRMTVIIALFLKTLRHTALHALRLKVDD